METLLTPATITASLVGYLLGSIPFGLLLSKAAGLGDIRKIGSGNIGATNVLRTGNKALAAATLLLDMLKGTAATIAAYFIANWLPAAPPATDPQVVVSLFPWTVIAMGGFAAFIGHLFPVWLGFKGGKGVATYIGVLLGLAWPAALVFCGVWLLTAFVTKYSSLSALVASASVFVVAMLIAPPHVSAVCAFMTALLIFKHRGNIKRLAKGEEPRIGDNGAPNSPKT